MKGISFTLYDGLAKLLVGYLIIYLLQHWNVECCYIRTFLNISNSEPLTFICAFLLGSIWHAVVEFVITRMGLRNDIRGIYKWQKKVYSIEENSLTFCSDIRGVIAELICVFGAMLQYLVGCIVKLFKCVCDCVCKMQDCLRIDSSIPPNLMNEYYKAYYKAIDTKRIEALNISTLEAQEALWRNISALCVMVGIKGLCTGSSPTVCFAVLGFLIFSIMRRRTQNKIYYLIWQSNKY